MVSYNVRRLLPAQLLAEIDMMARLNTLAWAGEGWNETWVESDDPALENPRTNSRALVRWWAMHDAEVFVAEQGGRPIGYAVGIQFNSIFAPKLEWWNQAGFAVRPQIGDYEMHAVYVDKEFRRNGLFGLLVQNRWNAAIEKLSPGRRLWVQTLPGGSVERYYTERGFRVVGTMHMKNANRIFLTRELCEADFPRRIATANG